MTDVQQLYVDEANADTNSSANPSFESVIQDRLSRRDVLSGTAGAAAIAMLGGLNPETALADHAPISNGEFLPDRGPRLDFRRRCQRISRTPSRCPLATVTTFSTRLAIRLPKLSPDYRNDGTDEAASYAHRAGDHHDAIQYFGLGPNGKYSPHSSDRGLLCMNHEAITPAFPAPHRSDHRRRRAHRGR